MKITRRVIVRGRVQGVNYRECMLLEAERLDVAGWVRNRHDGTVEAMLHGMPDAVDALLDWARRGPPAARVAGVDVSAADGAFAVFERLPSA